MKPIFVMDCPELYVPHAGWFRHAPGDEVARFLAEGWFEYKEQAFLWLYLRPGDAFLDGGAHAGLYSVVAGRATNNHGSIVAVEPHPASASLLEHNLRANGVTCGVVRQAALFSRRGPLILHAGGPERSAYSSVSPVDGSLESFPVEAITLDDMLKDQVQLAKLDVEGAELEVLAGAAASIRLGRLPVLIVECTEANLARSGATTETLFAALRGHGYTVCRFDASTCRLMVREYAGPIGYDNLFAVQDLEKVNQRLATAAESNRRIAHDILTRGAAAEKLFIASSQREQAVQSADQAFRNLGEANWRVEQAENRAQAAEQRAAEARSAAQESEGRAEEAALSAAVAFRSQGEAEWRAEQAENRARVSEGHAAEARKRAEEAALSAEAADLALAAARRTARESEHRAQQSRDAAQHSAELTSQIRLRLNEVLASRYLRAGWKLGLARKPAWVDNEPALVLETEMMRALRHLNEKKFQPRVVLDIGAGRGNWSILAGGYFKDATFYLLEPLTENEPALRGWSQQDPRRQYILTAVGQEPGERQIHIASDLDSSTMLLFPGDDDGRLRPLSVTTVDRLLEEGRIEPPDLVRIDVQGMELQVLQGCTQVFDHAEVFIIEVNLFAFMPGCPRVHTIIEFMAAHGYTLFDLAGSLRRPFEDDLGQLDLVLVSAKSPLIASGRWV